MEKKHLVINATPAQDYFKNRGIGRYTINIIKEITALAAEKSPLLNNFSGITIVGHASGDHSFVVPSERVRYVGINAPIINTNIVKTVNYVANFNPRLNKVFDEIRQKGEQSIYFLPRHTLPSHQKADSTVKMVHDLIPLHLPYFHKNPIMNFFLKAEFMYYLKLLPQADLILTNSEFSKQDVTKYDVSEDKIHSIPLASSLFELGSTIEKEPPIAQDYFIYYGGYDSNKNIPAIIEAFAKFIKKRENDVKLVFSGGEARKEWLQLLAKQQNIEKNILPLKSLNDKDLVNYLMHSKGLLRLALLEGFGLPELEAISLGVPIITSKQGPAEEFFTDHAFLHSPVDISGVAKSLEYLFNNPLDSDQKQRLKDYGQSFTWRKTAEQTINTICSL